MTTPIADGTYYIQNIEFPASVINLSGGHPYAAINGWPRGVSTNLQWIIKNVCDNQITLENVTARGYYLTVDYFFQSAPAFGSPNSSYWTIKEVTKGIYTIGAKGYLLVLHKGGPLASIILSHQMVPAAAPTKQQQWTFVPVGK